uniref:VWFA domain-containing protein n=1 Tax=Caenorhabditis tropicalis TaxID=1561998 RepID=A0A1I7T9V8_9PELO
MILLFCACFVVGVAGFGAPGIVPPESFIAERWYPSNLPTVMPPWKLAGVDISHFRTARPHQSPGTNPTTTTPVAPTNSLPMPPGTSSPLSEVSSNGPHPPSPPPPASAEASGLPSSSEEDTSAQNSTSPSSTEELMTLGVTATNVQTEKPEQGVLKILSPVFEDITKTDNISDSEEVLRVNSEKSIEGSGDLEPELMSTLETTTTSSKKTSTTASRTMTSESSVTTTPKPVTEPITTTSSTSSSSSTTPSTTTSSSTTKDIQDEVTTIAMTTKSEMRNTTKLRPTKECKDILFLLDSSGNVVQQYEKQKKYIEEIVHQLEAEHPRRVKARFLRGVTAAGAAISVTTQYVLQKNRNVQVVVVTDGFSFDDVDRQSEALRAVVGMETFVTGRYFPVVKNVLLSIGGADDHVFFEKKESRLVDALQC